MWWHEFSRAAPALAGQLRHAFEEAGIVVVGTKRPDGSARLSPVEAVFEGGHLYLDMMWGSRKARDLLQDARIEVHAVPAGRDAPQIKLRGRVVETFDEHERRRFSAATRGRLGWEPYPRHHLFRVDILAASRISYGEDAPDGHMRVSIWDRERGRVELGPYPPPGLENPAQGAASP
jgi:hypothetical protein